MIFALFLVITGDKTLCERTHGLFDHLVHGEDSYSQLKISLEYSLSVAFSATVITSASIVLCGLDADSEIGQLTLLIITILSNNSGNIQFFSPSKFVPSSSHPSKQPVYVSLTHCVIKTF